jgi:hypothetical protein
MLIAAIRLRYSTALPIPAKSQGGGPIIDLWVDRDTDGDSLGSWTQ